jgi:hypothetical protein
MYSKNGAPDDIWLWRGVFFAIESKADENGQVSGLQRFELEKIRRAGGISAVSYGYDEDKLERIKAMILKRTPDWVDDAV